MINEPNDGDSIVNGDSQTGMQDDENVLGPSGSSLPTANLTENPDLSGEKTHNYDGDASYEDGKTVVGSDGKVAGVDWPGDGTTSGDAYATGDPNTITTYCMHDDTDKHVVYLAPTCTTAGGKKLVCECGVEVTGVYEGVTYPTYEAPLGHSLDLSQQKITKKATCSETGTSEAYCTRCHQWINTNATVAAGHNWTEWFTVKAATCDTEGLQKRYCKDCEEIENRAIKPTGKHTFDKTLPSFRVEKRANCVEDGWYQGVCLTCGKIFHGPTGKNDGTSVLAIPHRNHAFDDGVIVKAVSCIADGEILYTCKNITPTVEYEACEPYTQLVVMSKDYAAFNELVHEKTSKWHKLVEVVEVKPTATTKGIHYYYCSVCKKSWPQETFTATKTEPAKTTPSTPSKSSSSTGKKGVTIPATNDTTSNLPYVLIAVAFVGLVALVASKRKVNG
jgi:hypothetical protein